MLVLSLKLSSGKNGHLLNLLLFENNFEKSSLIHKDHNKVQLHITFQVCLRIRSVYGSVSMCPFFLVCITLELSF